VTSLSLYLGAMMMASSFSGTAQPELPAGQVVTQLTADEQRFVDLLNAERWRNGLGQLEVDLVLVETSRRHSREMCDRDYFGHLSPTPDLRTPMSRYVQSLGRRPSWAYLGENLCYCSIPDVNRAHATLMNSPTHRANTLNSAYARVGVGAYTNERGEIWVTEMFLATVD